MHILLVEDNADLAANIGEYLEADGHHVDFASDGTTGLHLTQSNPYDAIVLDVSLPGIDGLALCKRLRDGGHGALPVLMLTARDTERDKLAGFDAGADDYLTKPFSLPELKARLKALVRRSTPASTLLDVEDLTFDTRTMIARRGGIRLDLTPSGLRLLEKLMRASPAVVTRREVERVLWDDDPPDSDAAMRGHIHALRNAIDQPFDLKLLHTVHGVGYRLAKDDAT